MLVPTLPRFDNAGPSVAKHGMNCSSSRVCLDSSAQNILQEQPSGGGPCRVRVGAAGAAVFRPTEIECRNLGPTGELLRCCDQSRRTNRRGRRPGERKARQRCRRTRIDDRGLERHGAGSWRRLQSSVPEDVTSPKSQSAQSSSNLARPHRRAQRTASERTPGANDLTPSGARDDRRLCEDRARG